MGNIIPVWLFWLYCFFLDPAPSSNRRTDCYAEWLKWHVSGVWTMGGVIWGKYSPKTFQKGAWTSNFKPKCQNLYIAISPELLIRRTSDLRSEIRPRKALRGWSAIAPKQTQHGWRPPSWKSIWRHISAADVPIWTKFGSRMQNDTPITAKWSRSKPEVVISQPTIEIYGRNLACW